MSSKSFLIILSDTVSKFAHFFETQCIMLCQVHKTVLDKYGKPDDVFPGLVGRREQLPSQPLSGMYNKSGNKVRLTFKMELNQVWIGTKGN